MIKNYFNIAIRNLVKHKFFSFINIAGLATGITSFFLIALFVFSELNYETGFDDYENIYRARFYGKFPNNVVNISYSSPSLSSALLENFPEVISSTRFNKHQSVSLRYVDKTFDEENFYSVDSTFTDVISLEVVYGSLKNSLNSPNKIILTEKISKKYFGNIDPTGKVLESENNNYLVTAVVKDLPQNTHFQFDLLSSIYGHPISNTKSWYLQNVFTYFKLEKGTDKKLFEEKINSKFKPYLYSEIGRAINLSKDQLDEQGITFKYIIEGISDIHLYTEFDANGNPAGGRITYVYAFILIAFSILAIACFNFINLSTAKSIERSKEIGIRKTLGSTKLQLVKQFFFETFLMTLPSVLIALFLVEISSPFFTKIFNIQLSENYLNSLWVIPIILLFTVILALLSGLYPSFYLSKLNPIKSLSNQTGSFFRNSLVIIQFSVCIFLIISTILTNQQIDFILNKNLGFNKDYVIVIDKSNNLNSSVYNFTNELSSNSNINAVSNSSTLPGKFYPLYPYKYADSGSDQSFPMRFLSSDNGFTDVFEMKLKLGRFFSEDRITDSTAIVLNETALKTLGIKGNPIGKNIVRYESGGPAVYQIIGVLEDFNFESLHNDIQSLVIHLSDRSVSERYISVSISKTGLSNSIKYIEDVWKKYSEAKEFKYTFFDDDNRKLYESEERTKSLLTVFSLLAIFVTGLGLLGLTTYAASKRSKEIGIRKVLGASVIQILILMVSGLVKLVVVANIVAWPISFLVLDNWLENFHYKINIDFWLFAITGFISLIFTIITVFSYVYKSATVNPVESLHDE